MPGKFEVYQMPSGRYGLRLRTANGEIIATANNFPTMDAAREGCENVLTVARGAPVVEGTP